MSFQKNYVNFYFRKEFKISGTQGEFDRMKFYICSGSRVALPKILKDQVNIGPITYKKNSLDISNRVNLFEKHILLTQSNASFHTY